MDPQSSNERSTDDIEIDYAEVHVVHDAAEHLRNPTSGNNVLLDDQTKERLYIPKVASSCVPVIGMEFSSIEQAYFFIRHMPRRQGSLLEKEVDKFVQAHNHSFVCPEDIHLLSAYRHLSETQEEMIWELGTLNLGPVKAFNIMRQRYRGFENVGATVDDCKNFRARIHSCIGEYDADMVITRLTDKKQFMVDYSFVHLVDENKCLTGLFWADGLCKFNYTELGDVISFDAMFKTNKYKMVFVPFTGIDNHCRNVTLVGHELCNNEDFKRRMCDIVWTDSIAPETFERDWKLIMIEFGLTENKWIDDMFGMRSSWIPAYYPHEPMSGLIRTASRSESENHFFCQVVNSQLTLVEFFNHFDGAMDVQRFNHQKNDHISRNTTLDNWSATIFEEDAMKIYTRSIFCDQQTQLYETLSECLPMETKIEEPFLKISMKDFKAHYEGLLEVCFKKGEDVIASCSCRRFEQCGLLCKHIYLVFKMFKVKEIPNKYVIRRWTKDVVPNDLNNTFDLQVDDNDGHKKAKEVAYEIMHTGEYLVSKLMRDFDHLVIVRDWMRQMKEMVDGLRITKPIDPKFDRYSRLIGYEKPNTDVPPTVRVPTGKEKKRRVVQLETDPGLVDEEDEEAETGEGEEEYEEVDEADDSDSEWEELNDDDE
ncbi:protein FAR1-RELATED SEQUENCE 1-like [Helianthus annuus]|uniref:protein FAR1-RELATED SEQUENCE 1-like n=1 Tax=Helianthus annuus TaxID=4232 RepID=UPI000B904E80|nr:protein FAR1-RELATED SEQUENCE 1-like [Helianthus annuus]